MNYKIAVRLFFLFVYTLWTSESQGQKMRFTIPLDGVQREFYMHIPGSYNGINSVPLVFMLHGTGGDGEVMYTSSGWAELSEKEGFIAVFPSSMRYRIDDNGELKNITKWNTAPDADWTFQPGETGKDDIKFLRKIIEEIVARYNINTKRIYLNGFSNGGQMAAKCSIEMSDLLAAVCSNAGSFYLDTVYIPLRKIPYLYQVGNRDYGPGNVGPDFPAIPMHLFDTLISTPGIPFQNGKHYRIAHNCINNFSLDPTHGPIVGDSNFALLTTYNALDPKALHEFKFILVKDLGHSYPNWAPEKHWEWMKNFTLDGIASDVKNENSNQPLFFYPNPASHLVILQNEELYKITDFKGCIIKQGYGNEISISDISNGMYVLKTGHQVSKLIIEK